MSFRFSNRLFNPIIIVIAAIILTFSCSGGAYCQQALTFDEKAARAFKFAKGLFDMQKYKQAASELNKFISFYENSRYGEYALYLLGEALYKNEEYKDALERYEKFQKKYPASSLKDEVYYSAAYTLLALEKPEKANDYFLKLYNSDDKILRRDAIFKCALYLNAIKDTAGAKKAFDDYFKSLGDTNDITGDETGRYKESLYISANIALREKRRDEALNYYERFLKSFASDPAAAAVKYNIGEIFYSKGAYEKAAEYYKAALAGIDSDKKNGGRYVSFMPGLHYSLGWCYYSKGAFKDAAAHFEKCFSGYPAFENIADCGLRLGISLYNSRQYDRAVEIFKQVKKINGLSDKISGETDYYLGMALQKTGLTSEAFEYFSAVSNASDEIGIEALYASAVILFDQKKYEPATDKFRALVSKFPFSARAQNASFNICLAYFNMAKYKEAKSALLEFINKYPNSDNLQRSYFNLGEIAIIEKNYNEAISWFSKIPQSDQIWLEAELKICDAYSALKEHKKLSANYQRIIAAVDSHENVSDYMVPALFKMGKNLAALNENVLAIRAYEKALALSKSPRNSADARFKLAILYFEIKNYEKCLAACDFLLDSKEAAGNSFSIYEVKELKGRLKMAESNYEKAIEIFDDILAAADSPEHVRMQTRFYKAMVYFDKKEFDKAVENFESLASDVQDIELLAKIHLHSGRAYYELKNIDEAIKNLLKIEILFKDSSAIHEARLKLLEIYTATRQKKDAKNLKAEIMKSNAPEAIKDRANELFKK